MGLRPDGEKPAAVLRLVYLVGWLPALVAAWAIGGRPGAAGVVTAAGPAGALAGLGLAATLTILTLGYAVAIKRPPSKRTLIIAAAASLGAALVMPILFSADIYAYAYFGDLALTGHNPYGHGRAPDDPLARAAIAAWGGRIPPRCVYGPLAVALAAAADLAGAAGGVPTIILAGRIAAVAAYAGFVAVALRLVPDPRSRVVLTLNPTVIWSVAEGHNDAAMLALVCAGLATRRGRAVALASAALVKAPAVLVWGQIESRRGLLGALVLTLAGYLPLALAVAGAPHVPGQDGGAAAWQSPLGLVAALIGRAGAVAVAVACFGAGVYASRDVAPSERTAALALAGWFTLPNAYPWYALWIVPIAARNVSSMWSRALLAAAAFAPARSLIDAVYAAADRSSNSAHSFHPAMIGLEFVPPLAVLGWSVLRRPRYLAAVVVLACSAVAAGVPAQAQSSEPSPLPQPLPAVSPSPAQPAPTPSATITPLPPPTNPPPLPAPPLATAHPFAYIITPPPVPTTAPDGPHILEVDLNDRRIRVGGPLIVRVITSANVVGVEARALGRFIPIPQNSPGTFALAYTLPDAIPFWLLNRNYDIVIAAATADGRQVTVSFPMLLMR